MTQQAKVLYEHMQKFGTLTQIEAYENYGCFRLASRICEMKKEGIPIEKTLKYGKNRYGIDVRFAEYRIKEAEA